MTDETRLGLGTNNELTFNLILIGQTRMMVSFTGTVATSSPFIGCMRDILVNQPKTPSDFSAVPRIAGAQLGTCITTTGGQFSTFYTFHLTN